MTDLSKLKISEARDALRKGDVTSVELTEACLLAIDKADALGAFVHKTPEVAIAQAKSADDRIKAGDAPDLCGIPLGIKDLFCTKGVPSQAASAILNGFKPEYESTVTSQLFGAGAVMLGKLNMDEFAMGSSNETSTYGNAINPWRRGNDDTALTPGRLLRWLCLAPSPQTFALGPQAPTLAGRSASPQPLPASPASNPPMVAVRAGASWPLLPRWIRPVR